MRNLFLVILVCGLGGFYRFSSPSSVISSSDLTDMSRSVEVVAQRRYCPMSIRDARRADIADMLFREAVSRGYEVSQLNGIATLDAIDERADVILAGLQDQCASLSLSNDIEPLRYASDEKEPKVGPGQADL